MVLPGATTKIVTEVIRIGSKDTGFDDTEVVHAGSNDWQSG